MNTGVVVTILVIMLVSGMLGGLINCFIADPNAETPLSWWKHTIVGIGAAFMVPVFLNMISSKLIESMGGDVLTAVMLQNLMILAGFCLLAAISSRAFIQSLTDRILKEVSAAKREARQANEKATNAEAIAELDKNEPEAKKGTILDGATEMAATERLDIPTVNLTESEMKIVAALGKSTYLMRTRHGLAADTGMTYEEVVSEMPGLVTRGLVIELLNSKQQRRWALSEAGRELVKTLPAPVLEGANSAP